MLFRYSRWDGTQSGPDLDADDLLEAMSDDLLADGDLWSALRRLFQRGMQDPNGARMPGLQDLLQRLRQQRQRQLDRYDLGSAFEDIKKKLDEVLKTEREGIDRRVNEVRERAKSGEVPESHRSEFEKVGAEKRQTLDQLPPDAAGQIRAF